MKEQFVPYELAIKLKELGFDEKCFSGYNLEWNGQMKFAQQVPYVGDNYGWGKYSHHNKHIIKAPLWQQAFDWFRENHDMYSYIVSKGIYGHYFIINGEEYGDDEENCGFHYEEAKLKCLEKLIEIHEQTTKNS